MTSRTINAPFESPATENTWDLSGGVRIPAGFTQQQHDTMSNLYACQVPSHAAATSSRFSFAGSSRQSTPQSGARVAEKSCTCKCTALAPVTPRVVEQMTTWNAAATTFFRSPSGLITFFILHGEVLLFTSLVARPGPRTFLCGVMGNVLTVLGVTCWMEWVKWK